MRVDKRVITRFLFSYNSGGKPIFLRVNPKISILERGLGGKNVDNIILYLPFNFFSFQKVRPVNTIELAKQLTIGAIVTTSCTIQLEFSDMVFDQISAYVLDWVISHDSPLKKKCIQNI